MRVLLFVILFVSSLGCQAQMLKQPRRPAELNELDYKLATVKEPAEVMRAALGYRKAGGA